MSLKGLFTLLLIVLVEKKNSIHLEVGVKHKIY